jgi:hypothetical protein
MASIARVRLRSMAKVASMLFAATASSVFSQAYAELPSVTLSLNLRPLTGGQGPAPVVVKPAKPIQVHSNVPIVQAVRAAPIPLTIRPKQGPHVHISADTQELARLVQELREIDAEFASIAADLAGNQWERVTEILLLLLKGEPPGIADSGKMTRALERSRILTARRQEVNRRIFKIVDPQEKMYSAPYHVPADAGSSPANSVSVSDQTARGAVQCRWEDQPRRTLQLVAKQIGFDRNGAVHNYVYEPVYVPNRVEVCD